MELNKKLVSTSIEEKVQSLQKQIAGTVIDSSEAAIKEALENRQKVDVDASTLDVGDIIQWNPKALKLATTGTRGAVVSTCPCLTKTGAVTAKNVYLSSFSKVIRVYDQNGERVLNPDKSYKEHRGTGNKLWEAAYAAATDFEVEQLLVDQEGNGRYFKVAKVIRDYGPRFDSERNIVGRHMTSLALFVEVDNEGKEITA